MVVTAEDGGGRRTGEPRRLLGHAGVDRLCVGVLGGRGGDGAQGRLLGGAPLGLLASADEHPLGHHDSHDEGQPVRDRHQRLGGEAAAPGARAVQERKQVGHQGERLPDEGGSKREGPRREDDDEDERVAPGRDRPAGGGDHGGGERQSEGERERSRPAFGFAAGERPHHRRGDGGEDGGDEDRGAPHRQLRQGEDQPRAGGSTGPERREDASRDAERVGLDRHQRRPAQDCGRHSE
jgi:hypothetical protein